MNTDLATLFQRAAKVPFNHEIKSTCYEQMDIEKIKTILPQRDFLLLVDQVSIIDHDHGLIVATYELARADKIFACHFPGLPIWPGIIQIEAIGQVGNILFSAKKSSPFNLDLKSIDNARFISPITPKENVEIQARIFEESESYTILGQCIHKNQICSVVWLTCHSA